MEENIITLSNGIRVANISSSSDFTFEDGTVLPGGIGYKPCISEAIIRFSKNSHNGERVLSFENLQRNLSISSNTQDALVKWHTVWAEKKVDIVICPRVLLRLLHRDGYSLWNSPFRGVHYIKDSICSISEFYIKSE